MTSLAKRRLGLLVMLLGGLLLAASSFGDCASFSPGGGTTIESGAPSHPAGGRLWITSVVCINGDGVIHLGDLTLIAHHWTG